MARTPPTCFPSFEKFSNFAAAVLIAAAAWLIAAPASAGPDDISDNRRYDQAAFLTAHNAFAATDLGWVYAQQKLSIREQLEYGVRGFMLDVYKSRGGRNEANCRSVRQQIKKTEKKCQKTTKTDCKKSQQGGTALSQHLQRHQMETCPRHLLQARQSRLLHGSCC